MKIESGSGNGKWVSVTDNNQLNVYSETSSQQHIISLRDGNAYQVWGTGTCVNGTVTILHLKNNSTLDMVVSYIRWQILDPSGGTALPNASNYLQIGFDTTYSSGGTSKTPTNMNSGSGKLSSVTAYNAGPTTTGTIDVFDRHYPKEEGEMYRFNKEGSLIIPPGKTMEINYVGDHTSGTVYTRVSFYLQ